MKKPTIKSILRHYFLNGNAGTNEKLADLFGCSKSAIRKAVMELRDDGLPIERPVFRSIGHKAVYRLADQYYSIINPTDYQDRRRGRPAFDQTLEL